MRRLLQRTAHEIRHEIERDEVQHDRADDFEHVKARSQHRGDRRPRRSGDDAARPARSGAARPPAAHACASAIADCRRRADEELTFGADVEDAGAKRDRDRESGENQRRRADERAGAERVPRAERAARTARASASADRRQRDATRARLRSRSRRADESIAMPNAGPSASTGKTHFHPTTIDEWRIHEQRATPS